MMLKNKKGELEYTLIFALLNLIVFSFLLIFIWMTSTNALIYEQTYSKQIALAIDAAKPNMTLVIDVSEGIEVATKNKIDVSKAFEINSDKKEISVRLNKKGGYSFYYFSNYNVSLELDGNKINVLIK